MSVCIFINLYIKNIYFEFHNFSKDIWVLNEKKLNYILSGILKFVLSWVYCYYKVFSYNLVGRLCERMTLLINIDEDGSIETTLWWFIICTFYIINKSFPHCNTHYFHEYEIYSYTLLWIFLVFVEILFVTLLVIICYFT